jgi:hypothetical protein
MIKNKFKFKREKYIKLIKKQWYYSTKVESKKTN